MPEKEHVHRKNREFKGNIAYQPKYENVGFYKKLVDKDGSFIAGVIADMEMGGNAFVDALFVEEPLRCKGLGMVSCWKRKNGQRKTALQ